MRHHCISVLFIGLVFFTTAQTAVAETATFEITATVIDISDFGGALNGSVNYGDQITGTYTIDLSTPDSDPNPEYAHYMLSAQAPTTPQLGFDLLMSNHSLKSDPSNSGFMLDAYMMNSFSDHFGMGSWGNMPLPNGSSVDDIFLDLYDPTGMAMSTTALSNQAPDIMAFEIHEIHVSGTSPSGQYYFVNAKIDSITPQGGSACVPSNPSLVTFDVSATVRDVWDYDNALANAIKPGDLVSGQYTFNTNTPDMDPNPDFSHYEYMPGSGNYGFDINVANFNIKTNTTEDFFAINIENNTGGPDSYSVDHYGAPKPFANNSLLEYINIFIFDYQGGINSSTALTDQPPGMPNNGYKDIYFGGSAATPAGNSYFSIVADIASISKTTSGCEEQTNPIAISPASGVFDQAQRFDAAIILEKDLSSLMYMDGTLNGFDITPELWSCFPGTPNSENRQTFICPDFSYLLMPGNNHLKIDFTLIDGQVISNSVDWMVFGY